LGCPNDGAQLTTFNSATVYDPGIGLRYQF
jgi:hypothetical protein